MGDLGGKRRGDDKSEDLCVHRSNSGGAILGSQKIKVAQNGGFRGERIYSFDRQIHTSIQHRQNFYDNL